MIKPIRVYPNPTTGVLNVEYYSKTSGVVKIKNVNGKLLYNTSANASLGNNNYTLHLHNLLTCTYVLELTNNEIVVK